MNILSTISSLQGNKYKIEKLLGSGGFGNTYLATQVALGRKVAIKEFFMKEFCERDESTSQVIIPTEGSRLIVDRYRQKFLKEAQMIASLRNEHIIKIYDIFSRFVWKGVWKIFSTSLRSIFFSSLLFFSMAVCCRCSMVLERAIIFSAL